MQTKKLYDNLLDALEQKVPRKSELVNIVTDILMIEKESAYRRLRGEIPFTLNEAGILAARMDISMDELIYRDRIRDSKIAYVALPIHTSSETYSYELLRQMVDVMKEIARHPGSEHGMALNMLPAISYMHLSNLVRFFILKWSHNYGMPETFKHFSEIRLSEQGDNLRKELSECYADIGHTLCIVDVKIIENIIRDIRYYLSVKLISADDVALVAADLISMLDDMQKVTQFGKFPSTGNKFDIYLSDITISTSYNYAEGGSTAVSGLTSFVFQTALSTQKETFLKIKDWVYYLRRMSTLITVVGVKERVAFLDRQRRLLDELIQQPVYESA